MTQISLFSGSATAQRTRFSAPSWSLSALAGQFQVWRERYRSRRDLMRLSDYQLKDIGLTRYDAEEEWRKPVWRG
ncbi:MAG: DUF1127 domain-containing protein [Rhodospirillaceae bacterium]|nr:DUF1127 domain-containing protein [Rhodospirillaceae bacterium]